VAEKLYSQSEANRIFKHLSPKTLIFWVLSGLVEWSGEHEDRRGIHRQYSLENLWQLGLAEELMSLNLPVKTVKVWMAHVSRKLPFSIVNQVPDAWHSFTLIVNKVKPLPKEEYDFIDDSGNQSHIAYKVPGWHTSILAPTTEIGKMLAQEMFSISLLVVMVILQNVVDKVDRFIKRAGV
jgi:hypothetical protein